MHLEKDYRQNTQALNDDLYSLFWKVLMNEMKALKCGTLGASFGKPCASGYVEGILDEYIHSIVCMYI